MAQRVKEYVGDSVYAEWDGYRLTLTTENGGLASNTICFDGEVWQDLLMVVKILKRTADRREQNEAH